MRLLPMLPSLGLGLLLGYAGWRGVGYLEREGQPARLLERAAAIAPAVPASGLTAVFLFRPDECPRLMGVIDLLNDLGTRNVRVVGALTVDEYRMPEWRALIDAERIRFPVFKLDPRKARAATASLGYAGGPLLIVFDRDRRVLFASDALETSDLRKLVDLLASDFSQVQDNRRARA